MLVKVAGFGVPSITSPIPLFGVNPRLLGERREQPVCYRGCRALRERRTANPSRPRVLQVISRGIAGVVDEQIARGAGHSVGTDVGRESVPAAKIDLSKMSDVELMAVPRDGQLEALAVLFDRFHRLILNFAARIVRDRAEAEDLMQEVFFEVFRTVGRFDPVS